MELEDVPAGSEILIDSSVFIYHFGGVSPECRDLLERCERGELRGITTTVVIAEVLHRLMAREAVEKGLVKSSNVTRKLRENPSIVKKLTIYHEQVTRIPLMNINVLPADLRIILLSFDLRREYGLLVNDSLIAAAAVDAGIKAVASADRDLRRVKELTIYTPSDIRV